MIVTEWADQEIIHTQIHRPFFPSIVQVSCHVENRVKIFEVYVTHGVVYHTFCS